MRTRNAREPPRSEGKGERLARPLVDEAFGVDITGPDLIRRMLGVFLHAFRRPLCVLQDILGRLPETWSGGAGKVVEIFLDCVPHLARFPLNRVRELIDFPVKLVKLK